MGTWAFMTASKLLWPWKGAPCGLTIITVIRTSSSCSDTALLQEQIFPFLLTSSQCYPSFIAQSSAHLITSNWIPTENKISYSFAPTRGHTASLTTQSLLLAWCPDADPKHLTGAAAGCGTASTRADRGHRETGRDPTMRGMQPQRRWGAKWLHNLQHQLLCILRFCLTGDMDRNYMWLCAGDEENVDISPAFWWLQRL